AISHRRVNGRSPSTCSTAASARHKVRLRACCCSVLDDCWLLDSEQDEPAPVKACSAPPPVLWAARELPYFRPRAAPGQRKAGRPAPARSHHAAPPCPSPPPDLRPGPGRAAAGGAPARLRRLGRHDRR